jgi:hypothetical protein
LWLDVKVSDPATAVGEAQMAKEGKSRTGCGFGEKVNISVVRARVVA